MVEAGAETLATAGAGGKTGFAKTLAAGATDADANTVLLTTCTADGAFGADQMGSPLLVAHMVGAQMAVALAYTTVGAFDLATMADLISTGRAGADMFGAGAFATRPTRVAAGVAVLLATRRTWGNTASCTDDLQAGGALANTPIAYDMAVVIDSQGCCFVTAGMATRSLERSIVTIEVDTERCLTFAVAEGEIGRRHGCLEHGIAY
ncbi:MAG: hypothetical protein DCC55_11715 [Chloroflexi bacterium]|nr:MAG: hypothetical protein DCC55_11715 [Chloroflexota bacterium]